MIEIISRIKKVQDTNFKNLKLFYRQVIFNLPFL